MPVPSRIDDGDWSRIFYETVDITHPFANKNDFDSVEARATFTQEKKGFRIPKSGSKWTIPNVNQDAYLIDPGNPVDIGSGLYRITRTFATIPKTRIEPATVAADIQSGQDGQAVSVTLTLTGEIVTQYSLILPKPKFKFRAFNYGNQFLTIRTEDGQVEYNVGNKGLFKFLSEDSDIGIYKGPIFYRRLTYAFFPNY